MLIFVRDSWCLFLVMHKCKGSIKTEFSKNTIHLGQHSGFPESELQKQILTNCCALCTCV